jgi:hypothetical protein
MSETEERIQDKPAKPANEPEFWTIRQPAVAGKAEAIAAAERAKITVPEWVGRAVREKIAREREDATPQGAVEVLPPEGRMTDRPALPAPHTAATGPRSPGEIAEYLDLFERVAKLRGKEVPPNAEALVGAERMIRLALRGG